MTLPINESSTTLEEFANILTPDFIPHVNDPAIRQRIHAIQSEIKITNTPRLSPRPLPRMPLDQD